MKTLVTLLFISYAAVAHAQTTTIHVFVALCDNLNQGIVPVPAKLGNGQDPANNLYWGAMYGVKSYFKYKTTDWELVASPKSEHPKILETILFKHRSKDVYLLAEAYDGKHIKTCTEDFLKAANGQDAKSLIHDNQKLQFGGHSQLLAYVGHDGLMDFDVNVPYQPTSEKTDVMILACYSKSYFKSEIQEANAKPLLWTTHLMAPEAYTLKAAIDGWLVKETGIEIEERAAQAYNRYQKCGIKELETCLPQVFRLQYSEMSNIHF